MHTRTITTSACSDARKIECKPRTVQFLSHDKNKLSSIYFIVCIQFAPCGLIYCDYMGPGRPDILRFTGAYAMLLPCISMQNTLCFESAWFPITPSLPQNYSQSFKLELLYVCTSRCTTYLLPMVNRKHT